MKSQTVPVFQQNRKYLHLQERKPLQVLVQVQVAIMLPVRAWASSAGLEKAEHKKQAE